MNIRSISLKVFLAIIAIMVSISCKSYEQKRNEAKIELVNKLQPLSDKYWSSIKWDLLPSRKRLHYRQDKVYGRPRCEYFSLDEYAGSLDLYRDELNDPEFTSKNVNRLFDCPPPTEFLVKKNLNNLLYHVSVYEEWEKNSSDLYYKKFGDDPFERENRKKELENFFETPLINMRRIDFDVSSYSIEKQEYTIPCDKGYNISFKLDKDSASKIRNLKTNVYLFTKYLYPPVEKKLEFKKQVLMVSILSIDESKDFEVNGMEFVKNTQLESRNIKCDILYIDK